VHLLGEAAHVAEGTVYRFSFREFLLQELRLPLDKSSVVPLDLVAGGQRADTDNQNDCNYENYHENSPAWQ
jgi:hypothetical protein